MRDYEALRRELPGDNEVAESLHQARVALKKFRGEEHHHVKSDGEVEEVSSLTKYKAAISSPGEFEQRLLVCCLTNSNYLV